jgi:predicted SAM-dependent methyltransferase
MKKLLHLGCGNNNKFDLKGFEDWEEIRIDIDPNVLPDILKSISELEDLPNGMADAIYTSHTIEHLYEHEVLPMLVECRRLLSPDGFVIITCPDVESACEEISKRGLKYPLYNSPAGQITGFDILYGLQSDVKNGNIYIHGRTDDVINIRGHRIGSEEIESVVLKIKEISECCAVAIEDQLEGQIIKLFVVSKNKVNNLIENQIISAFGSFALPKKIYYVKKLPKTRSGKILRRLIRAILLDPNKKYYGDTSTIIDINVIKEIKKVISKNE